MKNALKRILIYLSIFIISIFLSEKFLNINFNEEGESYLKGFGHILDERFYYGILFLFLRHFFISFSIFGLLFSILKSNTQIIVFYISGFILSVLLLAFFIFMYNKLKESQTGEYIFNYRYLEIGLTILFYIFGWIFSYCVNYSRKIIH